MLRSPALARGDGPVPAFRAWFRRRFEVSCTDKWKYATRSHCLNQQRFTQQSDSIDSDTVRTFTSNRIPRRALPASSTRRAVRHLPLPLPTGGKRCVSQFLPSSHRARLMAFGFRIFR